MERCKERVKKNGTTGGRKIGEKKIMKIVTESIIMMNQVDHSWQWQKERRKEKEIASTVDHQVTKSRIAHSREKDKEKEKEKEKVRAKKKEKAKVKERQNEKEEVGIRDTGIKERDRSAIHVGNSVTLQQIVGTTKVRTKTVQRCKLDNFKTGP